MRYLSVVAAVLALGLVSCSDDSGTGAPDNLRVLRVEALSGGWTLQEIVPTTGGTGSPRIWIDVNADGIEWVFEISPAELPVQVEWYNTGTANETVQVGYEIGVDVSGGIVVPPSDKFRLGAGEDSTGIWVGTDFITYPENGTLVIF
jgi:hypothetical protein